MSADKVHSLESDRMDCPGCGSSITAEEDEINKNRVVFYCYDCDKLIREVEFI